MLWTIFVILLVLWLLGMVSSYTLGGFIHVLLVVAIVDRADPAHPGQASRMKPAAIVGVLLIIVGIAGLAFGGFSFTHKEKVLDVGPIQASADKKESLPVPPILGALAFVGGVVLLATSARRA